MGDVGAPPLPLRDLRTIGLAQLSQRGVERRLQARLAAVVRMLRVGAPFRMPRQYRFHDLRLQIPNVGGSVAESAKQYRPGEGAQPGGKQQRLDLVGIHSEIPSTQT